MPEHVGVWPPALSVHRARVAWSGSRRSGRYFYSISGQAASSINKYSRAGPTLARPMQVGRNHNKLLAQLASSRCHAHPLLFLTVHTGLLGCL
ncbi:unnamed protein product [Protopolystoma xenopodis]|uniref:Uncharacterized protein n=1 Tax=Protopolystoma xenopodis TaxID=117903 RepID=A0A448WYI1_9PLAT|nr:unnamed protein product [Protopolystoma xenopodis]